MSLPDYWMRRPPDALDDLTRARFDATLDEALTSAADGVCPTIDADRCRPLWQFLCHVTDRRELAVHGSGNGEIELFEPRQPHDLTEFGNQRAVYAAADGIWAMFFAVVDRDRVDSIGNACVRVLDPSGAEERPFYVFAMSAPALPTEPWRTGTVYLLPRDSFRQQPWERIGDVEARFEQLASSDPVRPLAKVVVTPDDFPFLRDVRGFDDARLQQYATAMLTGAPWPDGR